MFLAARSLAVSALVWKFHITFVVSAQNSIFIKYVAPLISRSMEDEFILEWSRVRAW